MVLSIDGGVNGYGTQGNSEEFDTFRIGTAPHKKGTVVFSLNDFTSFGNILPSEAYWYYREVPDPTDLENLDPPFLPLMPVLEYNRTGGDVTDILGPLDSYERELPEVDNGGIIIPSGTSPNQDYWRQSLRAFDYQAFVDIGITRGVEYAIKVRGQYSFDNGGGTPTQAAYTWLHVDDLHYPSCIPWQGTNLVDLLPAGKELFRYNRSAVSTSSNESQPIPASPVEDDIYAETPYGEYVNEFYTTDVGNIVYQAADDAIPYINFKLDLDYFTTTPEPWTKMPTNQAQADVVNVTWVAGFRPIDNGEKYFVPGSFGVGARQTTLGVNVGNTINEGTLKIRKR